MKIRFIVNPMSGPAGASTDRGAEITSAVIEVFGGDQGIFEVKSTLKRGDGGRLAKEASDKGYDTIFACGGDGTINEVASALVGSDTMLGIVPGGSGNGLSRALSIPVDPAQAMALVKRGRPREIDAGIVSDRYFFSTAGAGFDAVLSRSYDLRGPRAMRGVLPYVPLALYNYFHYKAGNVSIKLDNGKRKNFSPFLLTAANTSEYGASAVIAPGAKPDDGFLDLCIVEETGFVGALKCARRLFSGTIFECAGYQRVRAKRVEVRRPAPGPLHADGEPFEAGASFEFNIKPKALKVWVPES